MRCERCCLEDPLCDALMPLRLRANSAVDGPGLQGASPIPYAIVLSKQLQRIKIRPPAATQTESGFASLNMRKSQLTWISSVPTSASAN